MSTINMDESTLRAVGMKAGDAHYRAYVGPPERYDLMSALQFNVLTSLGLREDSYLLDIGCGSLRGGKLSIVYLLPGRYYGVEPEAWLVKEGIANELGESILKVKRPTFAHFDDFNFASLGRRFDYMMAQSIFTHASMAQIARCLQQAAAVLREEGVFVATYRQGRESYTGDAWVYPECVRYRHEAIVRAADAAGLSTEQLPFEHPGKHTWVAFRHKCPGASKALQNGT